MAIKFEEQFARVVGEPSPYDTARVDLDSPKSPGRPLAWPDPWQGLADAHGGAVQLAATLGVSYATLLRWVHGRTAIRRPMAQILLGIDGWDTDHPVYHWLKSIPTGRGERYSTRIGG